MEKWLQNSINQQRNFNFKTGLMDSGEPVEDDLQSCCQSSSIQKGMSIQTKSILLKQGT